MTSHSRLPVPSVWLWPAARDHSSMEFSTMCHVAPQKLGVVDLFGLWASRWGMFSLSWFYIAHEQWSPRSVRKLVSLGEAELGLRSRTRNVRVCVSCVCPGISRPCPHWAESSQEWLPLNSLPLMFPVCNCLKHFELHRKFHIEINTSSARCVPIHNTHYNLSLVV